MIKYFVKKYFLSLINDVIKKHNTDFDKAKTILKLWIKRLLDVLNFLQNLLAKFDDDTLTPDEISSLQEDATTLIKNW